MIAELSSLRSLHLIGIPITDEGLKILARMPRLQSLYLDDSMVTEDGWEWLFEEARIYMFMSTKNTTIAIHSRMTIISAWSSA